MRTCSDHNANITPYAKKNQSSPPLAIASHLPPWCPQFCSRRRGAGLQQRWATTPTAGIQRKEFRWGQITSSAIRRPAKWDSHLEWWRSNTEKKKLLFNRTKCSISNTLQNHEIWNMCIVHHHCHIFPNSTNLRMTRSWMVLIIAYGFAPGETTAQPNSFSVAHCSRIASWSRQSLSFNES